MLSGLTADDEWHSPDTRAWVDAAIALILLVVSSPLLLMAAILPKFADGGPVLWRGERLGKGRKPFVMYKIRSLVPGADGVIGPQLMTPHMAADLSLEHRFGRFLRESHLDELPQFFNVLKDDMRLLGPRPVRRALYEKECRDIPGYDRRFSVKPGLFGYSQVLTPHSTDKRIRKKLDNHFIGNAPESSRKLLFLSSVLIALVARLPFELVRSLQLSRKTENRKLHRVGRITCRVHLENDKDSAAGGVMVNLSDSAMSVCFKREMPAMNARLCLEVQTFQWGRLRSRKKTVYCRVLGSERRPSKSRGYPFGYVIRYEPVSPLNRYLVQKYLLRRSLL